MKNIKKFEEFHTEIEGEQLNELNSETIDSAISKIDAKGRTNDADKYRQYYGTKELDKYIDSEIRVSDSNVVINGFRFQDDNRADNGVKGSFITINYSSPRNVEFNRVSGKILYDITNDKYINVGTKIDRRTATLLWKIAKSTNTETKITPGSFDIKDSKY